MTITRLKTFNAELKTTEGMSLYGGGSVYPVCSTGKAKSGVYSYASLATDPPFGGTFTATTAIRCGLFHNHMGGAGLRPLLTITVGASILQVTWNGTTNQFRLQLGYTTGMPTPFLPRPDVDAQAFSQTNVWRHIGATYLCNNSTGFFSLYIDGTRFITYTGDTTLYASEQLTKEPAAITGVFVGGSGWTATPYTDDFYIDSIVGEIDRIPPMKRFFCNVATGAGTYAEWTPFTSTNISQIDDPITDPNDGDNTYNVATEANLKDTFVLAPLTLPNDYHIESIIPVAVARKLDTTGVKLALLAVNQSGTTTSASQPLSTAYTPVDAAMNEKPGGGVWTIAEFNRTEFGYKSIAAP